MSDEIKKPRGPRRVRGAEFIPLHGDREVTVYPIQEHELKTIGICNSQVAVWSSVASSCFVLIVSCLWDACMSDKAVPAEAVGFMVVAGLLMIVAIIIAFFYWWQKTDQIAKIKDETKPRA